MSIALIVEFAIKPGKHADFDRIIREHAQKTKQEEPGCERFDVLQPTTKTGKDESKVCLVEVYKDQAAFKAHGENPRLAKVREAYADLITDRKITICEM
jgi:quinol monooxygenase YgiN